MELVTQAMTKEEADKWESEVGNSVNQLRVLLSYGYERKAWLALGYSNWTECVHSLSDKYGFSERHAWRLHAANETEKLLTHGSVGELPERQMRPLTSLSPDTQIEAWQRAMDTAPGGKITAAHVQHVVDELTRDTETYEEPDNFGDGCGNCIYAQSHGEDLWCTRLGKPTYYDFVVCNMKDWKSENEKPHVANNSGNNEWYTPPEYIEAARLVMGGIDLDPASSEIANRIVKATVYFTAEDDGLRFGWDGKVWMNPPYSRDLIGKFTEKLTGHFLGGEVTEAIVLVNNATETDWFQAMLVASSAVCFVGQRIKFIDLDGNASGAPLQGQAILYLGRNRELFAEHFEKFGTVLYGR
jgi:ParB family chromosome partitioning protein